MLKFVLEADCQIDSFGSLDIFAQTLFKGTFCSEFFAWACPTNLHEAALDICSNFFAQNVVQKLPEIVKSPC